MKTYFVVFSNPIEGKETEYNEWYSNIHLQEVVQIDGFISAQRFKLTEEQQIDNQSHQYMAIYEIENEDVGGTIKNLEEASVSMTIAPVIDLNGVHVSVFKSITDVVK